MSILLPKKINCFKSNSGEKFFIRSFPYEIRTCIVSDYTNYCNKLLACISKNTCVYSHQYIYAVLVCEKKSQENDLILISDNIFQLIKDILNDNNQTQESNLLFSFNYNSFQWHKPSGKLIKFMSSENVFNHPLMENIKAAKKMNEALE